MSLQAVRTRTSRQGKSQRTSRRAARRPAAGEKPRRQSAIRHLPSAIEVFSVGHSTHSMEDFIALLKAHGVERLVDVRTIPRSRHNPQFDREALAAAVRRAGLGYIHFKALGGLRHTRRDSPNTAWRNLSFRGFADYMQTATFNRAVDRLIRMARPKRIAILCAEAVPWRCHRSLIADALVVRGAAVRHILSPTSAHPHTLTLWAQVRGNRVTYPGE